MRQNLLIALVILAGCAAIPVTLAVLRQRQLRRLAAGRHAKEALEAFIGRLSNFDRVKVEAVYRELQGFAGSNYPLMPDDRLLEDLDIDQETLESFFEDEKLEQSYDGPTRINTCADLAAALIKKRGKERE